MIPDYDVVVIGLGHAGCEAALAASRLGVKVLATTLSMDAVARMSCNPSIGGPGKSQLVREIDALGGEMGAAADDTFIHIRMLNSAKGPAVRAIRTQIDRLRYSERMKSALLSQSGLDIIEGAVESICLEGGKVVGVVAGGTGISCSACIIATGTYLGGKTYIGDESLRGGPEGLPASSLSPALDEMGIRTMRFKTGTSPRVQASSLNYERMEVQRGDELLYGFSSIRRPSPRAQEVCWITYTNAATHSIIGSSIDRAPIFSGLIKGVGPRYCPSIEAKVVRFAGKPRHQLFIEPIVRGGSEMYIAGLATSLPKDVQEDMLRSIPGLEEAKISKYGYAIEYDCVDPSQLDHKLEFRHIKGLYSAGQSNGSSGYEEAAAQGLIAGANAALSLKGQPPLKLGRDDAYIGVLIDDLVMKGTDEPYRMMTARAEYRLSLRQDNADFRLTPKAIGAGLASGERKRIFELKLGMKEEARGNGAARGTQRQPQEDEWLSLCVEENIALDGAYAGYIEKERRMAAAFRRMEDKVIPAGSEFSKMHRLSAEAREKLSGRRPESVGEASRIPGISPADIAAMIIHLREDGSIG